jgi:cobyrinic acid a,c-diamide synthase
LSAPGLLIAAVRSGAGKTTLALGLMRALTRRGLKVGPFKCGPDYIDPAFHKAATGRESLNLDCWAMTEEFVSWLTASPGAQSDIIIAEGAMGLFDGAPGDITRNGSSAGVAAITGWPVVLVHDISGQGQSAAAIVCGVAAHDARVKLAGVVLNRVASDRHRKLAADAIEAAGVPVLGALPRSESLALPERHLGLVQAGEASNLDKILDALADHVEKYADVGVIRALARPMVRAAPLKTPNLMKPPGQRIAVARDVAFSFFYPHLARSWREVGAELSFFSPLANEAPPSLCDVCWLPGGYPELHAGRIAGASAFLAGLRRFAAKRPVHGECGGYMTLGKTLVDAEGSAHAMAGLLDLETSFSHRKLHLGYRRATLDADSCLGPAGATYLGHEFHYATILSEKGQCFAYVSDPHTNESHPAGLRSGNVSGSFFHVIA